MKDIQNVIFKLLVCDAEPCVVFGVITLMRELEELGQ